MIFDVHHHRCNPRPARSTPLGRRRRHLAPGVRPKVHLSSPRTELRPWRAGAAARAPLLDQHADFVTPWDLAELLGAAPGRST